MRYKAGDQLNGFFILDVEIIGKRSYGNFNCPYCETIFKTRIDNIRSGHTKSCGCYKDDLVRQANRKHGHASFYSRSPEYGCWAEMISRCYNPNNLNYKLYGGKGISVCDRWRNSFINFFEDMGNRPVGKSLDRWPNNDGNYEPGNVRWATPKEQTRNRRMTKKVFYRGIEYILADLCELHDLTYKLVSSRLEDGWPVEKAIDAPINLSYRRIKNKSEKSNFIPHSFGYINQSIV